MKKESVMPVAAKPAKSKKPESNTKKSELKYDISIMTIEEQDKLNLAARDRIDAISQQMFIRSKAFESCLVMHLTDEEISDAINNADNLRTPPSEYSLCCMVCAGIMIKSGCTAVTKTVVEQRISELHAATDFDINMLNVVFKTWYTSLC